MKVLKVLILSASFFGLLTFAEGVNTSQRICSTHYYVVEPVKLMPVLLKHYKELNLSKEQREEIKRLIREIKPVAVALDIRIDRLSREVRKDMLSNSDFYLVKSELNTLAALKVEKSLLNYKCIKSLKRILTEEQFRKLLRLAGY